MHQKIFLVLVSLHSYDQMIAFDEKTNQTATYYFNIDKPFSWLGNSFKIKE